MAELVHVTVRSRVLPDLDFGYDPAAPAEPGEEGAGSWLLRWLRPAATIRAPLLGEVTKAPWGEPGASSWPTAAIVAGAVLLGVLALAAYGAVSLVHRR